MLRELLSLILIFIASNSALSQTFSQNRGAVEDRLLSEKNNDSLVIDSKTNIQIQKKVFDSNQKVSPEVFYIVNDKPVSREEYLKHSKKQQ
ncbi:MAG: hypothetical protein IPN80_05595 [Flavobacterium sp.]|nr:hypothetical protein [Flavobacterium sp.]